MKEEESHKHDAILDQWAEHRRSGLGGSAEFTRSVMEGIRTDQTGGTSPTKPATRFQQVALTAACATVGIGKFLIIIRLAV